MAIPIGTLGTIPTITIAGTVFTDLTSNLIMLTGYNSTSAHTAMTLRKFNGGAGYQVTNGKTLTVRAAEVYCATNSVNAVLAQTDNDVGLDSNSAFTNAVYESGANVGLIGLAITSSATNTSPKWSTFVGIASQKYCSALTSAAGTVVRAWGYEA